MVLSSTILSIDAGSNNPAIATVGLDQPFFVLKTPMLVLDQAKRYVTMRQRKHGLTDSSDYASNCFKW